MSPILWITLGLMPLTSLLIASLDVRRWQHRRLMVCGVLLLFGVYLGWRVSQTVLWGDFSFAGLYTQWVMLFELLWFVDVAHGLHFYAYPETKTKRDLAHELCHAAIDVIVPTYNEPAHVLERTLMAAKNLEWMGPVRVFVLDDSQRDWLPQLCKTWGATYLSRPDNASAKAGNINHALPYMHGDFTLVLDADFMVAPQAIEKLIAPMANSQVAIVQAPQEFYNPDPIQRSLGLVDISPTDQSYFFNDVLQARNNGDAAFFCGTCGLLRNSAIKALGGFPTESITEDIFLSLKLSSLGYQSVAITDPVAVGMSPETLNDMFKQRKRWGVGAIQMNARLWLGGQEWQKQIPVRTKLKFIPVYWVISYPVRLISLLLPQLYFLLGWVALVNVSLLDLVVAQGSVALTLSQFNQRTSGRHQQPFVTAIWHDMLALRLTPVFMGRLFRPFTELPFVVTPKGRTQGGKKPLRVFDGIVTCLLGMTVLAMFVGVYRDESSALRNVSLFWTLINFVRLLFVHTALRHEKPRTTCEMSVSGQQLPQLWLEGGALRCPVAQCVLSETSVMTRLGAPVGHVLIQLHTHGGLTHIGRTDAQGAIDFFSADMKSVWTSHLVGATLRKVGAPIDRHTIALRAFLNTLKTSVIRS